MRKFIAASVAATALTLAVCAAAPVWAADADPSVHQIYEAAQAGHLDQAQQMMNQVLRDHPSSARAHYVQAELYAREGKTSLARAELGQAEQLDPTLKFAKPQSLQELKSELGGGARSVSGERAIGMPQAPSAAHFPWGMALILVGAIGVLWMLFRRRNTYAPYPATVGGAPGAYGTPGYGGPGYGPGPMGGGGIGSGIAGGLASGLAVGAGVVAGEELAHHFLDGGRREGGILPVNEDGESRSANGDMGGSDFGVNDPGSWDDSSGGGGGGGDWS